MARRRKTPSPPREQAYLKGRKHRGYKKEYKDAVESTIPILNKIEKEYGVRLGNVSTTRFLQSRRDKKKHGTVIAESRSSTIYTTRQYGTPIKDIPFLILHEARHILQMRGKTRLKKLTPSTSRKARETSNTKYEDDANTFAFKWMRRSDLPMSKEVKKLERRYRNAE